MHNDPLHAPVDLSPRTEAVEVTISTPLCNRYIAGYVRGVRVGPSPDWLVRRLEALGQRSINNVVDATNYIMFETGQPLHAFDAGQLEREGESAYAIEVRTAKEGETMFALDEKEYALSENMLVISDERSGEAIGVAGVKGGKPAGITESTTDIIIESANFDGPSVRKTAAALKLRTDASQRFEQGLSPLLAAFGMARAVELIIELAGGKCIGFTDAFPSPRAVLPVYVTASVASGILGTVITDTQIKDVCERLGFAFSYEDGRFAITPPFDRLDLSIPEDVVEEIGRIIGYDSIPEAELPHGNAPEKNIRFNAEERIRTHLASQGFSEAYTSVFSETGFRGVANKIGGVRPFLRASLLPGLSDALGKNDLVKEAVGLTDVRLFEIGTVWPGKDEEEVRVAIGTKGGKMTPGADAVLAGLCAYLGVGVPRVKGESGVVEVPLRACMPTSFAEAHIPTLDTKYRPFSRFPFIVRDISLFAAEGLDDADVLGIIVENAGKELLRADLFDRFEKQGRVSFAFRLIFQSEDRTLTDQEVDASRARIEERLRAKGCDIR